MYANYILRKTIKGREREVREREKGCRQLQAEGAAELQVGRELSMFQKQKPLELELSEGLSGWR